MSARSAFGHAEVQRSLKTTNMSVARQRWAAALADFERRLASVTGAAVLTDKKPLIRTVPSKSDIEEAVREWLTKRMDRATVPDFSTPEGAANGELRLAEIDAHLRATERGTAFGASQPSITMSWIAAEIIEERGWHLPEGVDQRRHLMIAIGRGLAEALRQQEQDLRGEPRIVVDHTFSAEQYRLDAERAGNRSGDGRITLWALFDGYAAESRPAPATEKAWRRFIRAFAEFVNTEDATRISFSDVVRWKEHLLAKQVSGGGTLSPKTVGDTYLAAIKTVFNWGVENNRLRSNPAALVRVRNKAKARLRNPDFTEAEALAILRATKSPPPKGLSDERARARRWVPWLCAYSGARVGEITQMRAEDVSLVGDTWTIRITPEAGSTKTNCARVVAIHPHLLEQGFVDAIAGLSGPLFYDPARRREGSSAAHPQSKKVGQYLADWVRADVGVADPRVAPNHGWRHRFKTVARNADMNPEIRDYIQGHVPRTEGEMYGGISPDVTLREIKKLPRYNA